MSDTEDGMTRHWTVALRRLRACEDAVIWAREFPTLAKAWCLLSVESPPSEGRDEPAVV
jgi:hypothetical protein